MTNKTNIFLFGKTDVGRIRKNNEDAFVAQALWDESTYLVIAIDGVGGYEGGEIAADLAKKTIPEFLLASSNGERVELLKQAVTAANNAIFTAREADKEHGQMSCVLTAALIDVNQRQINMAHVGDSRLYSYHNGEIKKLSHDHSIIGYREEIGDLSEEEAMHHPQRNVIGRDVGSQKHKSNDEDFIEAQVFPLIPNTTLLLCSDGLTDMITTATISTILGENKSVEEKTDSLINAALNAGGNDNITVVLFEYQGEELKITKPIKDVDDVDCETMPGIDNMPGCCDTSFLPKKNSVIIIWLIIGLLAGAISSFIGMNYKDNCLKKDWEEQRKEYTDSIINLHKGMEKLQQHQVAVPNDSICASSVIEELHRQNDSLKFQLIEAEEHIKRIEKEVRYFVDQLDI